MTQELDARERKILEILQGKGKKERERKSIWDVVPTKIPITPGVLNASSKICDAVAEHTNNHYEWYSLLLASKSDPLQIARGILVPEGVYAKTDFVEVDDESFGKAMHKINSLNEANNTDLQPVGWLHSHGRYKVGFSDTDFRNIAQMMNTLRFNTQRTIDLPLDLIESEIIVEEREGKIVVKGRSITDALLEYKIPEIDRLTEILTSHGIKNTNGGYELDRAKFVRDMLDVLKPEFLQPKIVGFGYSVVVNDAHDAPHSLISVTEEQPFMGNKVTMVNRVVGLDVMEVENDIVMTDKQAMDIVNRNIRFPAWERTTVRQQYEKPLETLADVDVLHLKGVVPAFGFDYLQKSMVARKSWGALKKIAPDMTHETSLNYLADRFVEKAEEYIQNHGTESAIYSAYLHGILMRAGEETFNREGLGKLIAKNTDPFKNDLTTFTYDPENKPELIRPKDFVQVLKRSVRVDMDDNQYDTLNQFMIAFVTRDPNKAIEEYIPHVKAGYE